MPILPRLHTLAICALFCVLLVVALTGEASVHRDSAPQTGESGEGRGPDPSLSETTDKTSPLLAGRVRGTIHAHIVDEGLSCDGWDDADAIRARTVEARDNIVVLVVDRASGSGKITVDTDAETYRVDVGPDLRDAFLILADRVRISAEFTRQETGAAYQVDLTFDCADR